jgi:hypothetical protein
MAERILKKMSGKMPKEKPRVMSREKPRKMPREMHRKVLGGTCGSYRSRWQNGY